ncbi:FAD-linked oxidoreductase [Photobacterium gaetbulicola]|uniref:FAD-linked oxidoreductase n=1 Tax=Photobacterium gaetbulicola TaxID=1295392 RepID=A0A0B9GF27_9GAMM|nr:FAD-binding oxidoreductase [Photobacterium gaetbulicola]KHT63360.1 FAD-linked oxidoreductase [Photobacterium gaetbulicola]
MLNREQIVAHLVDILSPDQVITDEAVLKENSHDRFHKLPSIFGIYTLPLPAAVIKVHSTDEVSRVLAFMNEHGVNCVPRTGGSATEGGLETIIENSVVIDGSSMNKIVSIDPENMQATIQCGVGLEALEEQVREYGLTTGHSPQSKPLAQYGGLVATRSIGQFSTLYGGIEDMVMGLEAVLPSGEVTRIKDVPRRACGPDIRHIIIGNEGALCYITEVTIKLFKYMPENNLYLGYRLQDMREGFKGLREVMANGYRPSVARLYDAEDGRQHGFDQFAPEQCVLIFMAEGPKGIAKATAEGIEAIAANLEGCERVDSAIIENWFTHLNWGPEKIEAEREFIRKHMNMGFTTEVSGNWSCINNIYENALRRIHEEFPHVEDLTMLGGHSSHSYQTGTNMYFVYDYNVVDCEPEEEINKYHIPLNAIIAEEAIKAGGSMVHHHGIGKHRTEWTEAEHGSAYRLLTGLKKEFDPNGIMNTGTIFPLK